MLSYFFNRNQNKLSLDENKLSLDEEYKLAEEEEFRSVISCNKKEKQNIIGYSIQYCDCYRNPTFFEFVKSKLTKTPFDSRVMTNAIVSVEIPDDATIKIIKDPFNISGDNISPSSPVMSTNKWTVKNIKVTESDSCYKIYDTPLVITKVYGLERTPLEFICDKEFAEKRWGKAGDPSIFRR